MTDRAFKFLEKNHPQFSVCSPSKKEVADLLEQFHAQCLPTDEEILSYFGEKNDPTSCYNKRLGAKWCRDFVREEPKAVDYKVSPTEKKEVKSCKTCAFHDVFYLDFPCIGCWDQVARIYLLWTPKSPKEPSVKEILDNQKKVKVCITCKYAGRPLGEACVGCGNWTNWQPKEPTLEDEINALKEPTVENATTHDLLTELIKRNLK
jgi:hypothetical protein